MSSAASQYFQNSQFYQQNPQFYTPMVNVPKMNRLPSHGELAASVDLLIAHVTKITNRLDRIESRVNDWVNLGLAERMVIVEKGIDVLTTRQNENGTKIASTDIELDYAFDAIKCANDRMVDNEKATDRIVDIMAKHESKLRHAKQRSHDNSKKCAEIGVLRRRISKVEDFNTEFAECFETPSNLRDIVTQMSSQVEECDRTLSYIVKYDCEQKSTYDILNYSNFCEGYEEQYNENDRMDALNNVQDFFASYDDGEGEDGANNEREEADEEVNEEAEEPLAEEDEDEDFEKL